MAPVISHNGLLAAEKVDSLSLSPLEMFTEMPRATDA